MDAATFFDLVLKKRELNPTSLATAIRNKGAQSGFDRLRKGLIRQPKRPGPIDAAAKHLGVNVLAFYDEATADAEWARISRNQPQEDASEPSEASPPPSNVVSITANAPQTYPASDKHRKPIWVVGKASGGMPERLWTDNDFPVGDLYEYAEEASSDPSAFLVEIDNTSMLERYAPGEFALVEPHTPVQPGDDVLVRLATGQTLVKRLDMIQNGYRLRSLNGGEQLFFSPQQVTWVYYVAHPVPRRRIKTRC